MYSSDTFHPTTWHHRLGAKCLPFCPLSSNKQCSPQSTMGPYYKTEAQIAGVFFRDMDYFLNFGTLALILKFSLLSIFFSNTMKKVLFSDIQKYLNFDSTHKSVIKKCSFKNALNALCQPVLLSLNGTHQAKQQKPPEIKL